MEMPADEIHGKNEQHTRQSFAVGDVVLSCQPWVCALQYRDYMGLCAYCLELPDTPLLCSGCRLHHYCGKKCQSASWMMEHKRECKMLKEINTKVQQLEKAVKDKYISELGFCTGEILMAKNKIINKIKNGQKEKSAGICGERDAVDVLKMLPYNPRYDRRFSSSNHTLHALLWPTSALGSMPADYDQLARKVYYNAFHIWDSMEKQISLGAGIFIPALHRQMTAVCWDINVTLDLQGRTLVVRATEDIADYTGLKDLRQNDHTHNLFCLTLHERRILVGSHNLAPCACWKCTTEYDAEINPLKCISSGCTERIPSDDRALQACSQCGAMNDQRLRTLKDLMRRNFVLQTGVHNIDRLFFNQPAKPSAIYPQHHLGRASFLQRAGVVPWMWDSRGDKEKLRSKWKEILEARVLDWLWEAREIYRKLSSPGNEFEQQLTNALRAMCNITTRFANGEVYHISTDWSGVQEYCNLNPNLNVRRD